MIRKSIYIVLFSVFLGACSSSSVKMPANNKVPKGSNGGVSKVGRPYKVAGKWYYPKHQPGYNEVGIASWYGKQFHGKKTANGEIYNMNALTAAHKTLPLPTNVKVTNLENGRSIVVRVNDRGPFVGDRVIDLSRRAAQILGFEGQGTTKVRVQVINNKDYANDHQVYAENRPRTEVINDTVSPRGFIIQAGSFSSKENARTRIEGLKNAGINARISTAFVNGVRYFRVIVDYFSSRQKAEEMLDKIQSKGFFDSKVITQ